MASRTLSGILIECVQGDIVQQPDVDVVVNAANAQLMPGGGVAGAIHRAAGSGLADECRPLAPIRTGQAVITGAHGLPNRRVVHCLGPVYGRDEPSAGLLASCYREALRLADAHGMTSVAFPSISTGIFGYPMDEAARVALGTVAAEARALAHVRHVRFVLRTAEDLAIHDAALASVP